MAVQDTGPLTWTVPIVDTHGRPSPEFQRRWNTQRGNNALIGTASFGSGPPTGTPDSDGARYYDVNVTPFTAYVGRGGSWHKAGVAKFTDLSDVPAAYTGAANRLVTVNGAANALQFSALSAVIDTSIGSATGDMLYRASGGWSALAPTTNGFILTLSGGLPVWAAAPATGVTSVGLAAPSIFTVSGSPVTTSGTLTFTLNTQSANVVFAGPTSGGAATPTFRALVNADFPASGAAAGSYTNANITVNAQGIVTAAANGSAGGGGTVTSVAMTVPSILSVAGSPITTAGTLAVTLATQAANTVFAGPTTGAAATPTFRAIVTADLPASATSSWIPLVTGGYLDTVVLPTKVTGLTLSTAGASATFSVAAGQAADSTLSVNMALVAFTKTTGAWAAGAGNGALDTGSVANSTWYHVFVIAKQNSTSPDILVSTSASAPIMPAGYVFRRRIGSMKTDGSAKWTLFQQIDNYFKWDNPPIDVNGVDPGTTGTLYSMSIPPNIQVLSHTEWSVNATTYKTLAVYSPIGSAYSASTDILTETSTPFAPAVLGSGISEAFRWTQTQQLGAVCNATGSTVYGLTYGWTDPFIDVVPAPPANQQPQLVTDGAGNLILTPYGP